jgi:hypothetical protein
LGFFEKFLKGSGPAVPPKKEKKSLFRLGQFRHPELKKSFFFLGFGCFVALLLCFKM